MTSSAPDPGDHTGGVAPEPPAPPLGTGPGAPPRSTTTGPPPPAADHLAGVRVALDAGVEVAEHGRVLIGGSPTAVLRLSPAGAELVGRLAAGDPVPPGAGATALVRRLLDRGIAHPTPRALGAPAHLAVTVVVPTLGPLDPALVDHLARLLDAAAVEAVLVVDDASPPGRGPTAPAPVQVLTRSTNGGPAAARNSGLAQVTTPLVAFVDADCVPGDDWPDALLPHFVDPLVAAVAPRLVADRAPRAASTEGARHRYDAARGPLDLGPHPARVRPGTRVGHVPAAFLVARTEAVRALGGFDEALRVGEDVDLVWRLDLAHWTVRHEPRCLVVHRTRTRPGAWLHQRFAYGTSAGPLAQRHPGSIAPLHLPTGVAAAWLLALRGHPLAAAGAAAAGTADLARRLPDIDERGRTAARLTARSHARAAQAIGSALVRPWWPLVLVGLVASRRARTRGVLATAVLAPPLLAWARRRPALDPVRWTVLWLADDVAYGAGVWVGAWRSRTARPLLPRLTDRPWRRVSVGQPTPSRSTTKTRVSPPAMAPPAPRSP